MDKSLDESISSRGGSERRPGRGASSRGGSGRSTPTSGRTPYQRPPPRSADESWAHDMYGGGNNAQSRVVQPRSDAATNTRLVVTNVHYEVTVDDLKGIFSRVGTITRGPTIQYDRSGRSTGIVKLEYSSPREARDAINSFDGNLAKGQALSIKFDDSPIPAARPARREGFLSGTSSSGGDLLSRISGVGANANGRESRNSNGANRGGRDGGDVPRGLTRGFRRGGPARGQGVRGGRGGRTERKEANADDLDKDLEAYLKAPAKDDAPAKDGDVDMS
ncbi:hypothetical protein NliqN6_0592 [Naganishia liquefaciens]|uniref:RRM domain-containing protein n=1 Tax=Naganishia liquefaciens TaxID=104408 RepID=A0A8H3YCD1_9TREE|nr:hypothetical protein NliqN6_0592 [Naganishia liquefaciens]